MLRKLKWQIAGEPLAVRYDWCQGPVPVRGPAVEKHSFRWHVQLDFNHTMFYIFVYTLLVI